MKEQAMYFCTNEIYQKIRNVGGKWNDSKERPLVCLIESTECKGLFWAIPVGDWKHRDEDGKKRIEKFMALPQKDIRSCYYHVGKTNIKSIFFISDVIPITKKYIDREYLGFDAKVHIIKNPNLIKELKRKLSRVLAWEASNKNHFRQHITDIKNLLIAELQEEQYKKQAATTTEKE